MITIREILNNLSAAGMFALTSLVRIACCLGILVLYRITGKLPGDDHENPLVNIAGYLLTIVGFGTQLMSVIALGKCVCDMLDRI